MSEHQNRDTVTTIVTAVVLLGCLLAYGVALNGPLFFDDVPNLLANDLVQISGLNFDEWRTAVISSRSGIFNRPIAMFTFAANHAVAGSFTAFSLKTTNLVIHLLSGTLVYFFTRLVLQAPVFAHRLDTRRLELVAVVAASIWLLHPIHVSTVLYAVQRMAQLSTVFSLLGLVLFLRYRLAWSQSGANTGEVLAASVWLLLVAGLAVLSKENGALMVWLIVVLEVTLFQGLWRGRRQSGLVVLGWCALLLPVFLLVLASTVFADIALERYNNREFSLQERLLTQPRVLWSYVSWLLFPNILDMGFFHDDISLSRDLWSPISTLVSLLAWASVLGLALVYRVRFPMIAFTVLFFLVAHSMESSILPLEMVFEHRNYLPSVGLFVLLAYALVRLPERFKGLHVVAPAIVLVVLLSLLLVRTQAWSDELRLARFNVVNHPDSPRANFFYANALFKRFEKSAELELSADEQRVLAVASRTYYERMHAFDNRDFAALVMLYQLDTLFFPQLAKDNDWLGRMERLAGSRRLQSSDRTALAALVGLANSVASSAERERIGNLIASLVEKNPKRLDLLASWFRFLLQEEDRGGEMLPLALERGARLNPNSRKGASYIAQYYGTDDLPRTYEAIRTWLYLDSHRKEIGTIRKIFEDQ